MKEENLLVKKLYHQCGLAWTDWTTKRRRDGVMSFLDEMTSFDRKAKVSIHPSICGNTKLIEEEKQFCCCSVINLIQCFRSKTSFVCQIGRSVVVSVVGSCFSLACNRAWELPCDRFVSRCSFLAAFLSFVAIVVDVIVFVPSMLSRRWVGSKCLYTYYSGFIVACCCLVMVFGFVSKTVLIK